MSAEPVLWAHTIVSERDLGWLISEQTSAARYARLAAHPDDRKYYAGLAERLSETIAAIKAQAKEPA